MADDSGIWVPEPDFRKFSADQFLQNANRLIGDLWTRHTIDNMPKMVGDAWTAHVTSQLPNLIDQVGTALAPPAPPPPQSPIAAPPDPFASPTSSSTTAGDYGTAAPAAGAAMPTTPTAPVTAPMADPNTQQQPLNLPGSTQTTAGLSGGGDLAGRVGARGAQIMQSAADTASWLGDQGQKALQAVLLTEGGLAGARGDQGKSAGPLQFYEGGQLANFAQQHGLTLDQAKQHVEAHPEDAVAWAIGTPDRPGYLGAAIADGLGKGLTGADLATYAQRHGQVSVSPERAGQNFQTLFGSGQDVLAGAGQAVANVATGAGRVVQAAVDHVVGSLRPSQFGVGLSNAEAYAACGPVAAMAFARALGRNPTPQEAVELAKRVGWTPAQGMAGPASELDLLKSMGVPSHMEQGADPNKIAADVTNGNPVIISTPGHYFVVDGYDQNTGKFHAGTSGTDLKAGAEWMNLDQMQKVMGTAQATLFLDRDPNDGPSVASQMAQAPTGQKTFMDTMQPAQPAPQAPPQQPKSIWDQLGEGISGVFKNVFGGSSGTPSTPPPPEGGGYGAVPAGGANPLPDLASQVVQSFRNSPGSQSIRNLEAQYAGLTPEQAQARSAQQATAMLPQSPGDVLGMPGQPVGGGLSMPEYQALNEQRRQDVTAANPLRDVPVVGGIINMLGDVGTDPTTYLGGPLIGRAAEALPVGEGVAANILRSGTVGAGYGALQGVEAPGATPESVAGSTAAGAAFGAGSAALGEGAVAGFERLSPPTVARAATGIPPEGGLAQTAGNINLAKYPEEVQQVIQAAAPTIPESARRGVVPDAVVRDLAQQVGSSVPDIVARWQPGQAYNAETLYALSDALANRGRSVLDAQQALRANPGSVDAQAALVQALTEHRSVQEVVEGSTAESGRALRVYRQPVTGEIAALQQLQTLAARTGQAPADLAQRLATLDLSDPVHMGDIAKALNPPRLPPSTELLGQSGPTPGQLSLGTQFGQELPTVAPISPSAQEARGTAERQPGQLGLGMGEQFQQDLLAPLAGGFEVPRTAADTGPSLARTRMAIEQRQGLGANPNATGVPAEFNVGAEHVLPGFESAFPGIQRELQPGTAGNFETPNVPTPAQTPEQADYLRRALTLKALREGTPLPDIPYQGPRGTNLQPAYDPSRAFDYDKLAQMRQSLEASQPRMDLNVPPKPNRVDQIIALTTNNMLSGIGTQIQNILGNVGATVERPLVTAAGGLVTGKPGMAVDALRDVATMGSAFSEAFRRAGTTLQTGVRSGAPEQSAAQLPVWAAPQLRILSATDEFFRVLNAAGGQAAELSRLMSENPTLSFDEAMAKYKSRLVAAGEDAAARSVYEKGGIGWGDRIAELRSRLLHSDKWQDKSLGVAIQALAPFSKVPDTILTLGIRQIPGVAQAYGLGRARYLMQQGETYAARRELGATALLTASNLAILAEALQGNITGDGPDNPTLKAQMMAATDKNGNALWQPNSVRLPDGRWVDYGFLGPMEVQLATIANLVEGARESQGKINPNVASDMLNRTAKTIGNMWYLRGLSDVLGAISDGQVASSKIGNTIMAVGDRFVWQGGLLNELRQLTDPTVRDPQNVLEREANRIPGLEALVSARPNPVTGQPLQRPKDALALMTRGVAPNVGPPGGTSADILSASDIAVPAAPKQITVGRFPIALTHDEQRQYETLRGQLVDQMVSPLAGDNAFRTAPLYVREQVLRKMLDQASSAAGKMLIGQLEPNSLNQRLLQSQQTLMSATPFLPEDTSASAGRVPLLAR